MDNTHKGAPIIPQGTQNTVYGGKSFSQDNGQAPQVPVSDKSAETPQTVQNEAPKRTSFDELAQKKGFKSADDLAQAYEHLESRASKVEMSIHDLLKAREDDTSVTQPIQEQDVKDVNTPEEALKVVEGIVKKSIKPLEDRIALEEVFRRHADVKEYAPMIAQLVKENPGISWEAAYKAAKFDEIEKQSIERGKQEAYQQMQAKQNALVGTGKAGVAQEVNIAELMKDRNVPFSEIQKVMKEQFSQSNR